MARILKKRNRLQTQNNIVNAAMLGIGKRDMETVNINFIADLAGNNKVLIYRYFGGWNGLVESVYKKIISDLQQNTVIEMDKQNMPSYEAFFYVFVSYLHEQPVLGKILEWVSKRPEAQLAIVWEQEYANLIQKILELSRSHSIESMAIIRLVLDGLTFQFISKRKVGSKQTVQAVSILRAFYMNKELLHGSIRIEP